MNTMEELIKHLNNLAIACADGEKERVNDHSAIMSEYLISHINFDSIDDVLVFCIANNLLNTYVKQEGALFGYYFKGSIIRFLKIIKNKDFQDLKLSFQRDNSNTLLVVSICNLIQFSFHGVAKEIEKMIPSKYNSDIEWDAIRKQMCAISYFNIAYDYYEHNKEMGKFLNNAKILADKYEDGICDIKQIKFICSLPEYCFSKKEKRTH